MRTVEEWLAKHDDQKVPDHVRLRIFERERGVCHISGRKITPADKWELDHRKALADGGEHRESNLFPAIKDKHLEKTVAENIERAELRAIKSKHFGIRKRSTFQTSRSGPFKQKMSGEVIRR